MAAPTALHPRTAPLCASLLWKHWAGCHAVRRYDASHEREYFAFRHAVGLQDVTPLFKYEVRGPDAGRLLSRVTVRDAGRQKVGIVRYLCWCDDAGLVLDDGTVTRLGDEHYRMTSADPSLHWLARHARGLRVEVEDVSRTLAALALQGPRAHAVLRPLVGAPLDRLRFFRALATTFEGRELVVTRTGYTGDLGYELWIANDGAVALWDALVEEGRPHGLLPAGLDALDVVRVEAGFVLKDVDYVSARHALVPQHASTPFELGFDWMVELDRGPFLGRDALRRERERGIERRLVGLVVDWGAFERLHEERGLPPDLPLETCREPVPVFAGGRQVGRATSRAWSPTCKRYLALATVDAAHARPGSRVEIEATVDYERRRCPAEVVERPFFDPERKKATW